MHFLPPQSGAADPMAPSKVGGRLASGHRIAVTAASAEVLRHGVDDPASPPSNEAKLPSVLGALRGDGSAE